MAETHPTDFSFYVRCAKPLIFALPSLQDRALAAAWIKRLAEDQSLTPQLRNNYLKLLIYFLQKRKLDGPFLQHPNKYIVLSDFPADRNFLESTQRLKKGKAQPYESDFSGDLRTYVAYQDVEDLGIHCYYALSKYPLTTWYRFDEDIFPRGIKPGGMKQLEESSEERKKEPEERKEEKLHRNKNIAKFPVKPIGKKPEPDDRLPPSWGSNLIPLTDFDEQ